MYKVAGADMTNFLAHLLHREGYPFSTPSDLLAVQEIKETLCYVCSNYDAEVQACANKRSYEREYFLPDGSTVALTVNRFLVPEGMFTPSKFTLPSGNQPLQPQANPTSPEATSEGDFLSTLV